MFKPFIIFTCSIFLIFNNNNCHNIITNNQGGQTGGLIDFALGKILSLKYNLDFYYTPFKYSDLFILDSCEKKIDMVVGSYTKLLIWDENDIIQNLNKGNMLFEAHIGTSMGCIDKSLIDILKKEIQLKEIPPVNPIPKNIITIAVHIRKGNGGGEIYDGEQSSLQLYNFDRNRVIYIYNPDEYPFGEDYCRRIDCGLAWQTKFPPEQYYVDQIVKLSKELDNPPLYIQLFTDDKEPFNLLERIKQAVNLPTIVFHYENNRNLSFKERIACDLYSMLQFDVLIRSQSYFARSAQLMGDHKVVIYPIKGEWDNNNRILIMKKIVIKGNVMGLKK